MRTVSVKNDGPSEVEILARVLGSGGGKLSANFAKHILNRSFSNADKERMQDLVVRNQNDDLSQAEKSELEAFGKAGTLLSILKSQARRALRIKVKKPKE